MIIANIYNLMLDISWRVIYDNYFKDKDSRKIYAKFFNKYYNKILPGTDFVASINKNISIYKEELKLTSDIYKEIDNKAFRHIALGQNYFDIANLPYKAPYICD